MSKQGSIFFEKKTQELRRGSESKNQLFLLTEFICKRQKWFVFWKSETFAAKEIKKNVVKAVSFGELMQEEVCVRKDYCTETLVDQDTDAAFHLESRHEQVVGLDRLFE